MKKWLFALMALVAFFGCSNNDDDNKPAPEVPESDLVNPRLFVRLVSRTPMTGALEVYPCYPNSSTYFGNYYKGKLSVFPPRYVVSEGSALKSSNPVYLPIGDYNVIYWGIPKMNTAIYSNAAVQDPQLMLGGNLADQFCN